MVLWARANNKIQHWLQLSGHMKTSQKNVPEMARKKNKRGEEILKNKFISMKPETDGWGNMQNDLKDIHLFSMLLHLYYLGKNIKL